MSKNLYDPNVIQHVNNLVLEYQKTREDRLYEEVLEHVKYNIKKHSLIKGYKDEDVEQVLQILLFDLMLKFDPNHESGADFLAYYFKNSFFHARNEAYSFIRGQNVPVMYRDEHGKRHTYKVKAISLEADYTDFGAKLADIIEDESAVESINSIEFIDAFEKMMQRFKISDSRRTIILEVMKGTRQEDIAERLGITQSRVSSVLRHLRKNKQIQSYLKEYFMN